MASIVSVEQIKGLASGSTPNTVTIPTGQTLHAPGHVIQTIYAQSTSFITSTTASWVEYLSSTITPKLATSKILIQSITCYGGVDNCYSAGKCGRTITGGSEVAMRLGNGVDPETIFTDASFGLQTN